MTGKFPYCGKKGVPCPLVDIADFLQNNEGGFNMRTQCNSSIPAALLPWMGCRPIVDIVVSSTHPCFEYNMQGWGTRDRPTSILGTSKHCVRKDERYRFMKFYPFVDESGDTHSSPSTGIFYRNELYYNPKCQQPQDNFEDGYLRVRHLRIVMKLLLVLNALLAIYVGVFSLAFSKSKEKAPQQVRPRFEGKHWDYGAMCMMTMRLASLVLSAYCASKTYGLVSFFSPLTLDKTCVDRYVMIVISDIVSKMNFSTMIFIVATATVFTQVVFDCMVTPFGSTFVKHAEGAPLLQQAPKSYEVQTYHMPTWIQACSCLPACAGNNQHGRIQLAPCAFR